MKRKFLSFTILLVFLLTFSFTSNVFSQTTPISQYGRLKVVANHLCDVNGLPIQLRGMSSHGLQWFGWGDCINEASLDALAQDWQSGIFRVAMYVDEGGTKRIRQDIKRPSTPWWMKPWKGGCMSYWTGTS
ncbi:MAG: glycoside hydrolase family 5 protein [Deltaproteobacteria bacterium]|nr:glycoside hydrolase family 5 protein [Deltaproteobacteria bacterium]